MASDAQQFAALRRLTPADAVSYLAGRGEIAKTYSWQDLWQEEHARQFTVSRLARADLLQSLREQITKSVGGDLSRRDFMRSAERMLGDAGWWGRKQLVDPATGELVSTTFDAARLKLIFDTNTRMAYAAGQWDRLQRTRRTHPFLRYVTMRDDRVRPAHRAWDSVTLPVDHAFWSTHFPPNGWKCRCRVVAVSRKDYEAGTTPSGQPMKKAAPDVVTREWVNRRTGAIEQVPAGIDPGFGYNPGQARARMLQEAVQGKLAALNPALGAALWRDLQPTLGAAQLQAWQALVDATVTARKAGGHATLAHVVDAGTLQALAQHGVHLDSAAVLMRDAELLHALRDAKAGRSAALAVQVWRELPTHLARAQAYLDTQDQALVYAFDVADAGTAKVVVRINYREKGRFDGERARVTGNFVLTGGTVEPFNLREVRYVPLGRQE